MSILKKENAQSLGRAERKQKAVRTQMKAELSRVNGRTFGEDFNLEHSFTIVSSTVMAFGSSTDPSVAHTSFTQDLRSPSCVYLG